MLALHTCLLPFVFKSLSCVQMHYQILRDACQAAFPLWIPEWPNTWLNAAAASWKAPQRFLDSIAEPTRSVKWIHVCLLCLFSVYFALEVKRTVLPFHSHILKYICFQNCYTSVPLSSLCYLVNFRISISVLHTNLLFKQETPSRASAYMDNALQPLHQLTSDSTGLVMPSTAHEWLRVTLSECTQK